MMADQRPYDRFDALCRQVGACTRCSRMAQSAHVLNRSAGKLGVPILFVGEAPGRLGADAYEIPFHGDKAGQNFEELLDCAGITRADAYVTNAVLCNPKDEKGNNAAPLDAELRNCSTFLKRQIELVRPLMVVTLGAAALKAVSLVEHHDLVLRRDVSRLVRWFGRFLLPLYHPGQRAMVHRNRSAQEADYTYLAQQLHKVCGSETPSAKARTDVASVVRAIVRARPGVQLVSVHSLLYLIELQYARQHGALLTKAFFVRDTDGPYCVDLHPRRLRKSIRELYIDEGQRLSLKTRQSSDLFDARLEPSSLPTKIQHLVGDVISRFAHLPPTELRSRVDRTVPMRRIVREEKRSHVELRNAPIELVAPRGSKRKTIL